MKKKAAAKAAKTTPNPEYTGKQLAMKKLAKATRAAAVRLGLVPKGANEEVTVALYADDKRDFVILNDRT